MADTRRPNYEVDPALEPHLDNLVKQVKIRGRMFGIDNLITPPKDDEIKLAIQDSLSVFNRVPPESSYGWDTAIYGDQRFLPMIYKISVKLVLDMLVRDWTHNGYDINLEEFSVQNKLSEYQALVGQMEAELDKELGEFKVSLQKIAIGVSTGSTSPSLLVRSSRSWSYSGGIWGRYLR